MTATVVLRNLKIARDSKISINVISQRVKLNVRGLKMNAKLSLAAQHLLARIQSNSAKVTLTKRALLTRMLQPVRRSWRPAKIIRMFSALTSTQRISMEKNANGMIPNAW